VRKAANYGFNKNAVTTQILAGGKALKGPLPEELRGGCTDIKSYPYDLQKAKDILKKSKYTEEQLGRFNLKFAAVAGSERYKKVALLFCNNMKQLGINIQVVPVRWSQICQTAKKPETAFEATLVAQAAKVPHPYQYLIFYTPTGWGVGYPTGGMYYDNKDVAELVEKGNQSVEVKEQQKYYCEAQKKIAEDAASVFMHDALRLTPFWRYVKGYTYPVGAMFYEHRFDRFTMDTSDPLFKKNQGR
jgi:ABC-type transport system substrate-binding protein